MLPPTTNARLAEELFQRVDEAEQVRRTAERLDRQILQHGRCHENVARWLSDHPLDRPVRGWLVDPSGLQHGYIEFHAHSIVHAQTIGLTDVTLRTGAPVFKFLKCDSNDEDFLTLARAYPTLRHVVDGDLYAVFNGAVENSIAQVASTHDVDVASNTTTNEGRFNQEEVDVAVEVSTIDKGMTPEEETPTLPGCTGNRATCSRFAENLSPTCSKCSRKL